MDNQASPTLTQRAAELAQAAQNIGFMPSGVRATLEGVAGFAQDCAAQIEASAAQVADLTERLANESGTNAEILAKLGEQQARLEALEARGA